MKFRPICCLGFSSSNAEYSAGGDVFSNKSRVTMLMCSIRRVTVESSERDNGKRGRPGECEIKNGIKNHMWPRK